MHGYFLQLDDAKMSKSSGDFLRLRTLIDRGYDPLAYRYLCLAAHYRKQMTFGWAALDGAAQALSRLRTAYASWPDGGRIDQDFVDAFTREINQDLNTARALALVWGLVKQPLADADKKATLRHCDRVLGLGLEHWRPCRQAIPADIQALVDARQAARQAKQWAEADALRNELATRGFTVEDGADGVQVRAIG